MVLATIEKADSASSGLRYRPDRPETFTSVEADEADAVLPAPPVRKRKHAALFDEAEHAGQDSTDQDQAEDTAGPKRPLVRLGQRRDPKRRFVVLQQWEGIVTDLESDAVWAEIIDLTDQTKPREEVELPLAEVPAADRALLGPGCVFYWSIGYEHSPGGQISRVSEIRVRRTPQWSRKAVDELKTKALAMLRRFGANGEDESTTSQ